MFWNLLLHTKEREREIKVMSQIVLEDISNYISRLEIRKKVSELNNNRNGETYLMLERVTFCDVM